MKLLMLDDSYWMKQAYALALKAQDLGEVPVGAVIVSQDGQCLGTGYNQVLKQQDPTAHAEILAIREAAVILNNYRLNQTTLYVTLEPCCMCAGAIVHARIARVVFATRDLRAGAAGTVFNVVHHSALNHKVQLDEGILQAECARLLTDFFKTCRERS